MSNGLQDHPLIHPVQVEIESPGFPGKITEQRMIGGGRTGKDDRWGQVNIYFLLNKGFT
jgi:hypothetical protein